ncbi:MAG: hypothetical protein IKZ76_06700 [Lachnospiraceae bacterium]|nr:hypothetical protein [Lachnospiraceae bacterium]MBR5917753.1 hypothetical protein [Lachnospiraceae bacterium]
MEEKEKGILPPKGTDGRYRDIRNLHIHGLILVLVLIIMLGASFSILGRTILSMAMDSFGDSVDPEALAWGLEVYGFSQIAANGIKIFRTVTNALGAVSYVAAFVSLVAALYIVYRMRLVVSEIVDDFAPYENPVRVKKTPFVWLGFLLGAYGGHLFLLKKKKAWIFLLLGVLGMQIIPLFLYTSGISFADAFMACFIEKDEEGYIEMEDYPYWL